MLTRRKGNKTFAFYDLTLTLSWAGRWLESNQVSTPLLMVALSYQSLKRFLRLSNSTLYWKAKSVCKSRLSNDVNSVVNSAFLLERHQSDPGAMPHRSHVGRCVVDRKSRAQWSSQSLQCPQTQTIINGHSVQRAQVLARTTSKLPFRASNPKSRSTLSSSARMSLYCASRTYSLSLLAKHRQCFIGSDVIGNDFI